MYTPSKKILENYSRVMVDFALGKGKGVKPKEVVYLQYDAEALPLALEVYKRILEKGAYPMLRGYEEEFEKILFNTAADDQLSFFPKKSISAFLNFLGLLAVFMDRRISFPTGVISLFAKISLTLLLFFFFCVFFMLIVLINF